MSTGSQIVSYDDVVAGDGSAGAITVLEANPNRKMAIITCLSTSVVSARIGDATVDTTRGTPLAAGETVGLPMKGEILACGEGGDADLAINEVLE